MTLDEAIAIMGPSCVADRARLRARYRRLAFLHHPDRNPDDAASFSRFKEIGRAYRLLEELLRRQDVCDGQMCARCNQRLGLRRGLDRNVYCRDCLVYDGGRRLLPAPPTVIASCACAAAAQLAALALLLVHLGTGRRMFAVGALVAALFGLMLLATSALLIGQAARQRRRR